jgi:hypothetical protein
MAERLRPFLPSINQLVSYENCGINSLLRHAKIETAYSDLPLKDFGSGKTLRERNHTAPVRAATPRWLR